MKPEGFKQMAYSQGGDAQAIKEVAEQVYGGYRQMFDAHGWNVPGDKLMTSASSLIVENYGSIESFEKTHFGNANELWDCEYDVRLTSLWAWMPSSWAAIGWSNDSGEKKRDNLLKKLTAPFIVVCYLTKNASKKDGMNANSALDGKLVGFYLVSHKKGHRNEFTAQDYHQRAKGKWVYAVRAIRAFSLLQEYRIDADSFYPGLNKKYARTVASQTRKIEPDLVNKLREMQFTETEIFRPKFNSFSS